METSEVALSASAIVWRLIAVMVIVLANAFFVAAELSLVSARRSRIDALAARGDKSAKLVQETANEIPRYLSVVQLGVTLASLALGWAGEATIASLIGAVLSRLGVGDAALLSHATATVIVAFIAISFLVIVIGELVPKSIAYANPEATSRWLVRPLRWFAKVARPFTWLLNGAAAALLRLLGVKQVQDSYRAHSPEELRLLVAQTRAHGMLNESDAQMLAGVFDFHQKKARDVMRPRTEIVAIPVTSTQDEVWELVRQERYSRYPVYGEDLDDMIGVFLAKDLWLYTGTEPFALKSFVREALYIPDTRAAERVLDDLRKTRAHMAIVLDEFGGTAGIVTMEDLVEEVIGDIADEYDVAQREALEMNGVLELSGSLSLIDVRSDHGIRIPEGSWSTLGGYVFSRIGRVPRVGDRVPFSGGELEVVAMDSRRVAAVRVHRAPETAASQHGGAG
ncbi:MAG TPA: hemolysin family protein [Gemmatimonadaceae bacterium]|nr:hemolysin family protein [Gemmatimonadaceae bacterium]